MQKVCVGDQMLESIQMIQDIRRPVHREYRSRELKALQLFSLELFWWR
jgi:hypothetical protein